jgi:hypothetical protein
MHLLSVWWAQLDAGSWGQALPSIKQAEPVAKVRTAQHGKLEVSLLPSADPESHQQTETTAVPMY